MLSQTSIWWCSPRRSTWGRWRQRRRRGRGPAVTASVYKATAAAAALGVLLSLPLGRHFRPLWAVRLPPARETARKAATLRTLDTRVIQQTEALRASLTGGPGLGAMRTGSVVAMESKK
jgi:hypothetical protein